MGEIFITLAIMCKVDAQPAPTQRMQKECVSKYLKCAMNQNKNGKGYNYAERLAFCIADMNIPKQN